MDDHYAWSDPTLCAHAGLLTKTNSYSGLKAIWQTSVYDFESLPALQSAPHIYRRYGCPNTDELAAAVAALEGADAGFATSSGMGAIVVAILSNCKPGDSIIVNQDIYGVTYEFFNVDMRRLGINVIFEDASNMSMLERNLKEISGDGKLTVNESKIIVFLESISNPLVKVANTSSIAEACKNYGALLVVDNTLATPLRMKPLLEGATLVVHSATKYLGGHDDMVAGVVAGSAEYIDRGRSLATRWGFTASPFDAWLALRGLHTLQVRMEHTWSSAATLAQRCAESQLVLQTLSAPRCAIVCIEVHGGLEGAKKAIEVFRLIKLSPSFGGTSTTVSHSATSSHKCLGPELRQKLGITDGILRVSVGLEDMEEIWKDLYNGLFAAADHMHADR